MTEDELIAELESRDHERMMAALDAIADLGPIGADLLRELIQASRYGSAEPPVPDGTEVDAFPVVSDEMVDDGVLSVEDRADTVLREISVRGDADVVSTLADAMGENRYPLYARWRPERLIGSTAWDDEAGALEALLPVALEASHIIFEDPTALSEAGRKTVAERVLDRQPTSEAMLVLVRCEGYRVPFLAAVEARLTAGQPVWQQHGGTFNNALITAERHDHDAANRIWRAMDELGHPEAPSMCALFGGPGTVERMAATLVEGPPPHPDGGLVARALKEGMVAAQTFPWPAWLDHHDVSPGTIGRLQLLDRSGVADHLWSQLVSGMMGEQVERGLHAGLLLLESGDRRASDVAWQLTELFRSADLPSSIDRVAMKVARRLAERKPPPDNLWGAFVSFANRHPDRASLVSHPMRLLAERGHIDRPAVWGFVEGWLDKGKGDPDAVGILVYWLGEPDLDRKYRASLRAPKSKRG